MRNAHPTLHKLIVEFQLEQQNVELWIQLASSGESNKPKHKQLALNSKIKTVVKNYNSEKLIDFFTNLYPNLKN